MRTALVTGVVCVLLMAVPEPAHAWGFEAHKMIMDRAIALLPGEIRPLFEKYRSAVVERSIDPDTWITAGFNEERPRHFLDIDWEGYGAYPFAGLPHDFDAAVAKFGKEKIESNGTVPWRSEEMHAKLANAFSSYARRGAFGANDIMMFSAWLVHYTSDAHVPLHTATNYDGQLTGQPGLHARWESIMFERYRSQLTLAPRAIPPIRTPREFIFTTLIAGSRLVAPLLKSDLDAIGSRDVYDDAYYAAFFRANRAVMEQRLNESIAAAAAMITGAWEAAGRPALPLAPVEQPQRRRR